MFKNPYIKNDTLNVRFDTLNSLTREKRGGKNRVFRRKRERAQRDDTFPRRRRRRRWKIVVFSSIKTIAQKRFSLQTLLTGLSRSQSLLSRTRSRCAFCRGRLGERRRENGGEELASSCCCSRSYEVVVSRSDRVSDRV